MDIAKLGREETWAINGSQQFHYESLCSLCMLVWDHDKSGKVLLALGRKARALMIIFGESLDTPRTGS